MRAIDTKHPLSVTPHSISIAFPVFGSLLKSRNLLPGLRVSEMTMGCSAYSACEHQEPFTFRGFAISLKLCFELKISTRDCLHRLRTTLVRQGRSLQNPYRFPSYPLQVWESGALHSCITNDQDARTLALFLDIMRCIPPPNSSLLASCSHCRSLWAFVAFLYDGVV